MTALEALNWHTENAARSPSDETILTQQARFELVESRPAPLNLTDTERLDWFGEYCDKYEYSKPKHVIIDCMGQETAEASFRDAIDLAAAKFEEANS